MVALVQGHVGTAHIASVLGRPKNKARVQSVLERSGDQTGLATLEQLNILQEYDDEQAFEAAQAQQVATGGRYDPGRNVNQRRYARLAPPSRKRPPSRRRRTVLG